ncbi:MAG: translation initiation factor IF-2 [Eubacteriales bacterium]|nr:translation initiation factor IF-2 [Eubacteriales bacterium]
MSKIQDAQRSINEKGNALLEKLRSTQRDIGVYSQRARAIAEQIAEKRRKAEEEEARRQEEIRRQEEAASQAAEREQEARRQEAETKTAPEQQAEENTVKPDTAQTSAAQTSAAEQPDERKPEEQPTEKETETKTGPDKAESVKKETAAAAEKPEKTESAQKSGKAGGKPKNGEFLGTYQPRPETPQQPRRNGQMLGTYQPPKPNTGAQKPAGAGSPRGAGTNANSTFRPKTGNYQPRQGASGTQRPAGGFRPNNQSGGRSFGGFDKDKDEQPRQQHTARPAAPRKNGNTSLFVATEKGKVSNYDPNKGSYRKEYEGKENVKKGIKTTIIEDDERMGSRRKGKKALPAKSKIKPIVIEHAVMTGNSITVKELSEKLGKPATEIIKILLKLDIFASINEEIDFATADLVAQEFNITLEQKVEKTFEEKLIDSDAADSDEANLRPRPPVVTIMGHVDHGKTSLLDAIRSTNVTKSEAGGITQHIGAYTVQCNGRTITFIDTPGHEAFTSMRARGAQVTDISVIVVAADDGIMPQTVEAINHSVAAGVPIIVAINKMDKPTANPDRVKQQLTEHNLVPEDWGGDTICVPVSAYTKQGLDDLLEMILLVADMKELKANPDHMARGTIVEARLDKGRGPVATVLIQNGTLRIGDTIVAGIAFGRVRAMMDHMGRKVDAAGPSMPVEILGFSEVPAAGDVMYAVEDDKLSKQVVDERKDQIKAQQQKAKAKISLDELFDKLADGEIKTLNVIVKADVQGSVEAVKQSLEKISNDEVRVSAIHGGVGAITETDIMLAAASNAIVVGFNVRPDPMARAAAENEKVDVRLYRIIYDAIEDIQLAIKGMLKPVYREAIIGHAEVRNTFKISGVGTVAGCYITDGKVTRNAKARVNRDNIVVYEGGIDSLKRFKDDAKEVMEGYECGITLTNFNDIKEGDVIESFVMEEIPR